MNERISGGLNTEPVFLHFDNGKGGEIGLEPLDATRMMDARTLRHCNLNFVKYILSNDIVMACVPPRALSKLAYKCYNITVSLV